MEARSAGRARPYRPSRTRARVPIATVIPIGAVSGLGAGMMMAMFMMVVGAIAKHPTAVPGIHTTFWTPVEGIWSVLFGVHHFHGDFHFVPVVGGMMGHMMNSAMLGVVGVAISTALLGRRPNAFAAMMIGIAFGLALEAIVVNGIINSAQKIDTLYYSVPDWAWWVGHGMFGATLGLLGSTLLRRRPAGPDGVSGQ